MEVAVWFIAFLGALAFVFAIKTELFEFFLFYTLLSAACTATVVLILSR